MGQDGDDAMGIDMGQRLIIMLNDDFSMEGILYVRFLDQLFGMG